MRKLTTAEFKLKAIAKHGDLYDYSLVEYVSGGAKVKIICKIHGVFEQAPSNHITGNGCPGCKSDRNGDASRSNTQDCIKKFGAIHGDLYDYSLVEYVTSVKKVKIICKVHGVFEQSPSNHTQGISGAGCMKCGHIKTNTSKISSTQEWLPKAIAKHGDAFDYSEVEYIAAKVKVKITCKKAGHTFYQIPDGHLVSGCAECANNVSSDTSAFKKKAILVHSDKFDYSEVEYVGAKTKVKITCKKAGHTFHSTPNSHLRQKIGCRQCFYAGNTGENHANWDSSKENEERKRKRKDKNSEQRVWRSAVFGRDSYKCQKCFEGRYVEAHHILPYARFPEVRFDVDNGITLCKPCHKKYHHDFGVESRCNRKTLNQFLSLDLIETA